MGKKRRAIRPEPPEPDPAQRDAGFLRAILDRPEDDTLRLVYADYLDENGDPARAEFIRVQIALSRPGVSDPERKKLAKREAKLLASHRAEWLRSLPSGAPAEFMDFLRGFPGRVGCYILDFVALDEALWRVAPVTAASLSDPWGGGANWGGMFDSEREVRAYHRRSVRRLAAARQLAHLASLAVEESDIDDTDARVLAASPHLGRLRHLSLAANFIGNNGAIALASAPGLGSLATLDLRSNPIGPAGAAALRQRWGEHVNL